MRVASPYLVVEGHGPDVVLILERLPLGGFVAHEVLGAQLHPDSDDPETDSETTLNSTWKN